MRKICTVLMVALVGCSGGDWLPPDIQEDEQLQELGAAGYQRLCGAFEDYIRDEYEASHIIQAVCLAHGIQTTTEALACGEAVNACTDNLPLAAETQLQAILAQARCSAVEVEPTGCAATVAQVKACLDALEDALDAVQFSLVCAAAGEPFDEGWWQVELPAACQAIQAICPAG